MKLSVIVPAYNEEKTTTNVLGKIKNVVLINNLDKEIVVVNDCSQDGTENEILNFIEKNNDVNIKYQRH